MCNKKLSITISSILIALMLLIAFSSTGCSANKEYQAYKYAIECVENELKFPNTATYPSFRDTKIEKSRYGTEIILDSYSGGKSFEYAWDISGSGTCENALGMNMNYRFTVTVVLDENGYFWCYKCSIT